MTRHGARQLLLEGDPELLAAVADGLAVTDPQFKFMKQRNPHMKWDGRVQFLETHGEGSMVGGIGLADRVRKLAKRGKWALEDEVDLATGLALTEHLHNEKLSADQVEASKALLGSSTGCIQLDVSSGKSYILLNLAACFLAQRPGSRFVIVVPKKALLYQLVKDAQKLLPGHDIGVLGDGHRVLHAITVATAATAVATDRITGSKAIAEWMAGVDAIAIDEAHHSTAATWATIIAQLPAPFLWGVSAKFDLGPGKKPLERTLEACFGPPLYEGAAQDFRVPVTVVSYHFEDWAGGVDARLGSKLVDLTPAKYFADGKWRDGFYRGPDGDGRVAPELRRPGRGGVPGAPDPGKYGIYREGPDGDERVPDPGDVVYSTAPDLGIMNFAPRNAWAVALARQMAEAGEIFLATCSRSRHIRVLARLMRQAGLVVEVLDGKVGAAELERIVTAWRAKEIHGVVAQKDVVSEGLSIPSLHHLIKLDGSAGHMLLHQQKGRPARREPGKERGFLHVPYDYQHPSLAANSRAVLAYYRKAGLEVKHRRYPSLAAMDS